MLMTDYAIIHTGQSTLSLLASSDHFLLSVNLLKGKDHDSDDDADSDETDGDYNHDYGDDDDNHDNNNIR